MRTFNRMLGVVVCALLASSCSPDLAVTPDGALKAPDAPAAALIKQKDILATGVLRDVPLAKNLTVSQVIGVAGGSITIPEAGVTITVPAGALSATTEISVTARKGVLIAYDFKPHGIVFATPLILTQQLLGTTATPLNYSALHLGYYADPLALSETGGPVSEIINGSVDVLTRTFTSTIPHFSGYMMGCGRKVTAEAEM